MFKDGSSLKHTELLSDTGVDSPYQPLAQTDGVLLLRYTAQFVGSSSIWILETGLLKIQDCFLSQNFLTLNQLDCLPDVTRNQTAKLRNVHFALILSCSRMEFI
jgi:hypothetical protein